MGLTEQWSEHEAALPPDWDSAQLRLTLEQVSDAARVLELLGPLQPLRTAEAQISVRISRDGRGPGPATLRRGLGRLETEHLHGVLTVLTSDERPQEPNEPAPLDLASAWRLALSELPEDWSDLLGEIVLDSSDYLDRASVALSPINPRRVGEKTALRFRSASRFGYGASPGMVSTCLGRCDRDGIFGSVRVVRVLCDSRPVGTQGPVWQLDGEMV
jgi:hypothetical protein